MDHLALISVCFCCVLTLAATADPTVTTQGPDTSCSQYDGHCDKCVSSSAGCLFCYTDNKCKDWPKGKVLPSGSVCSLDDARWGVCWLNFKVLLITMGVVAGVIIISVSCFIYCCCCRGLAKRRRARAQRDEDRWELEREERRQRAEERKQERQTRADEIRAKYGISKGGGYSRFDRNEVA